MLWINYSLRKFNLLVCFAGITLSVKQLLMKAWGEFPAGNKECCFHYHPKTGPEAHKLAYWPMDTKDLFS
jgi:hypothetical protein